MKQVVLVGPDTAELEAISDSLSIPWEKREHLQDLEPGVPAWITPERYPEPAERNADWFRMIDALVSAAAPLFFEFDPPFRCSIETRRCNYERFVARQTDHPATEGLAPLDLLDAHRAWICIPDRVQPCSEHREAEPSAGSQRDGSRELVSIARVSGFDRAIYGLPDETNSGIVDLTAGVLWSATSIGLPGFRRYKPLERWTELIARILRHLAADDVAGDAAGDAPITLSVPAHLAIGCEHTGAPPEPEKPATDGSLLADTRVAAYRRAISDNLHWFASAGMLIEQDGSAGVLEGYQSHIDIDGTQRMMVHDGVPNERADCNMQSAMAFLAGGRVIGNTRMAQIGKRLFSFSIEEFQYTDDSVYTGLWRWFRRGYESTVFYADDNGWACFFALLYGATAKDDLAIESGFEAAVALRDTWGANGHRRKRIDLPHFYEVGGREGLRTESPGRDLYRSPHYEAASMAAMGLASLLTGDLSFVQVAVAGMEDYLSMWPHGILFQHSENDDASKFIVALLFCGVALSRPDLIESARRLLDPFLEAQLPSGAIPDIDRLGERYGRNRSNADYGTFESSLFCETDDLVTDQVYGTSFLLIALYIAHQALPEDDAAKLGLYRLADYLEAIQLRDTGHRFLDGGWMRAFDPRRWEYFGSAGDWGYGPFLLETGWCQAIIDIGLSWIVSGEPVFPELDDATRRGYRRVAEAISDRQRAVEQRWREHTPPPVARSIRNDEPDVMQ